MAMTRGSKKRSLQVHLIFAANHDIKYDVDTPRAQIVASSTHTGILYGSAKDLLSLDALCVRSDLPSQKLEWLNRPDRESGDLCGVLPLMKGMPVAMSIHIDEHMDKRMLKGRV